MMGSLFLAGEFGLNLLDALCQSLRVFGPVLDGNVMIAAHLCQFALKFGGGRKMMVC